VEAKFSRLTMDTGQTRPMCQQVTSSLGGSDSPRTEEADGKNGNSNLKSYQGSNSCYYRDSPTLDGRAANDVVPPAVNQRDRVGGLPSLL